MTARQALWLATRGGAAVLGRNDIGSLETGKCADFIALDLAHLEYAGAAADPVSAVIFCQPRRVDYNAVGGRFVVREGMLATLDEGRVIEKHNQASRQLLEL
jgi:cytosine/adenosine deaminase-related metal-dependent hydrolase